MNVFFSVKFMSKPNVPDRVDIGIQECVLTIGRLRKVASSCRGNIIYRITVWNLTCKVNDKVF